MTSNDQFIVIHNYLHFSPPAGFEPQALIIVSFIQFHLLKAAGSCALHVPHRP